jgi:hypothetical protein
LYTRLALRRNGLTERFVTTSIAVEVATSIMTFEIAISRATNRQPLQTNQPNGQTGSDGDIARMAPKTQSELAGNIVVQISFGQQTIKPG